MFVAMPCFHTALMERHDQHACPLQANTFPLVSIKLPFVAVTRGLPQCHPRQTQDMGMQQNEKRITHWC